MSSRYSSCFALTSPKSPSRSTCEKPMIAFSGVRSSCDMFARNSDLCSAGGLELSVEALELVVHPVDVGRQRAELVAVRDVDMTREVPGGDRGEPGVDPLDRPDQRPREHEPEQQREDDRPDGGGDEEVSRARVRARVLGDQGVGLRSRDVRELGCTLVEVDRERLGSHAKRRLSWRAGLAGFDDLSHDAREPLTRRPDPLEVDLVLGRWPEQQVVGERRGRDQSDGARDRPVDRQAGCVVLRPVQVREVLVVVPADVLRLQQATCRRRRLWSLP